jgi:YgiT-type zinc finger domain-containing protein
MGVAGKGRGAISQHLIPRDCVDLRERIMIRNSPLPKNIEELLPEAFEYLRTDKDILFAYLFGSTLVVIRGVPAGVCQQCGEKYIDSSVYKEMEELAKTKSHLLGKMSVDVLEFERVSAA